MDFNKYKNSTPYPDRPTRPALPEQKREIRDLNSQELRQYADAMERFESAMAEYRKITNERAKIEGELIEQFRKDAIEEVGLTGHPKADKAYGMAWEHGHANGLSEVYYWLKEFAEFILS